MIRPRFAVKLARTKLRSRRGMLIASVAISSMLFAAFIACAAAFTGAEKSADLFVKKAGNDRYLVMVQPVVPPDVQLYTRDLTAEQIKEIKAFEAQYYANLRAQYKAAGVAYDASQEVSALMPDAFKSTTLPEDQRVSLNFRSPVVDAFRARRMQDYLKSAPNTLDKLKLTGAVYGATGYYSETPTLFLSIPNSHVILDGHEDLSATDMKSGGSTSYGYQTNAIYNSSYQFDDSHLLDRYLVTRNTANLKGIPVVVSAQEAARLFGKSFGIGTEPKDVNKQRAWLADVQRKLNGYTYQVCTRSSTEQTMLNKIQQDYADAQNHRDDKNYVAPALQYGYPTSPCGDIVTTQDSRSVAEKKAADTLVQNQKKLGTYVPGAHYLTTFQIVGFMHPQPYSNAAASVTSYLQNLLASQEFSMSAMVPRQMYDALPDDLKFPSGTTTSIAVSDTQPSQLAPHVLEFKTVANARAFLDTQTCPSSSSDACKKLYTAAPYGSNYLILDEIGKLFQRVIGIALPVLLGLAFVIVWFAVSRIMADSRRETAVYRAMGAARSDILGIYITYVLLIALRIVVTSLILGVGMAFVVDATYGTQLTNIALSSFGIVSSDLRFGLFDITSPLVWATIPMIFAVSLLASAQPLVRSVIRPPIRDMREE